MRVDAATALTHAPVHNPPQVYCNAPAVVSRLREKDKWRKRYVGRTTEREKPKFTVLKFLLPLHWFFRCVFFNTASSIALVVWQMQRQFFKHLQVNSHLICICVPWVKGLDQSGRRKFKSEAEMKLIDALCLCYTTSSPCIFPSFLDGETCLHSHARMCQPHSEKIWQTVLQFTYCDSVIKHLGPDFGSE